LRGRRKVNLTREKKIEKRKEEKEREKEEEERERERERSGEGEKKESIYLRRTQAQVRGERAGAFAKRQSRATKSGEYSLADLKVRWKRWGRGKVGSDRGSECSADG